MPARIYITGSGVVSAIGAGKDATLAALRSGATGVAPLQYLQADDRSFLAGEVKLTDAQMKEMLGLKPGHAVSRTSLMGILALREAVQEAGLGPEDLRTDPLISGTTVGGMDCTERYYKDYLAAGNAHSEYIALHDCGASTDAIADWFGGFAWATTLSTACSSAANAVILGANLIKAGLASVVAVGGSESLSNYHLNGFNSLMIVDREPCRPFDRTRAGLNLGEGAAFLILESEASVRRRGVKPLAEVAGYGNACDAFHQTASSEQRRQRKHGHPPDLRRGLPAGVLDQGLHGPYDERLGLDRGGVLPAGDAAWFHSGQPELAGTRRNLSRPGVPAAGRRLPPARSVQCFRFRGQ